MSENQDCGIGDFSKYDSMETEALEEILRLDAQSPEGQESDTELLLYVMGVLADRRRKNNAGPDVGKAWESFQQNYMPTGEEPEVQPKKPAVRKKARWFRGLISAAAVLAVVICTAATADALGFDIWRTVATWAQETFHFSTGEQMESEPVSEDRMQYDSLQELLERYNVEIALAPTWVPEGYELADVRIDDTPMQRSFLAFYSNESKAVKISIRNYLQGRPEQIEKSENLLEIYENAGISYYIFENYGQIQAVWIQDTFECYISGDLTQEQLRMMIDSIGKG